MPRIPAAAKAAPSPVTVNVGSQEPLTPPAPVKPAVDAEERISTWFWDKIAPGGEIRAEEWGKVYELWLQRLGDGKVPMASGEKGYLDTFTEPITLATIKSKYGGGKFQITLNKNGRWLTSHTFSIEGAPLYDYRRERPPNGAPANGSGTDAALLQQFMTMFREEMQRNREMNNAANPAENKSIEMMSSAAERAMDLVLKQAPPGANHTTELSALVSILKDAGVFGASGKSALSELIEAVKPFIPLVAPIIQRFLTPVDPLAQITALGKVIESIDALRGGGDSGGRPRDWKAVAAEKLAEAVPGIIQELGARRETTVQVAEENRRRAEAQTRTAEIVRHLPPASAAQPQAATAGSLAIAVPQATAGNPGPAPIANNGLRTVRLNDLTATPSPGPGGDFREVAAPVTSHQSPDTEIDITSEAYMRLVKRQVVYLVGIGQTGESIVDYLDGALPGFSEKFAQGTPEMVTAFMALDPILCEAIKHRDWDQILSDARAYLEEDKEPVPAGSRVQ